MNCFDKFVYCYKIYSHEWIPVNGTRYGGIEICDTQVVHVLTGCQQDSRVLGRHTFSSLVLFQILVHLVTSKMYGEYGIMTFIHQLLFQFLDIQYT